MGAWGRICRQPIDNGAFLGMWGRRRQTGERTRGGLEIYEHSRHRASSYVEAFQVKVDCRMYLGVKVEEAYYHAALGNV